MIKAHRVKISHAVLAQTLQLLMHGTVTAQQLSSHTGVHLVTAQEWLRALKEAQTVRVVGWLPDSIGRDATPVYGMGAGADTPRAKQSRAAISKRYRERIKERQD
jgi:predicted ArsR family transcriptional regulator